MLFKVAPAALSGQLPAAPTCPPPSCWQAILIVKKILAVCRITPGVILLERQQEHIAAGLRQRAGAHGRVLHSPPPPLSENPMPHRTCNTLVALAFTLPVTLASFG